MNVLLTVARREKIDDPVFRFLQGVDVAHAGVDDVEVEFAAQSLAIRRARNENFETVTGGTVARPFRRYAADEERQISQVDKLVQRIGPPEKQPTSFCADHSDSCALAYVLAIEARADFKDIISEVEKILGNAKNTSQSDGDCDSARVHVKNSSPRRFLI